MRLITILLSILISINLWSQCQNENNNRVDIQSVSIDPAVSPIKVGETTLIGFQINNNDGGTTSNFIPSGDAIVTVSYPSNIISINLSTLQEIGGDYTGPWTVIPSSVSPGSFQIENSSNFPDASGSILTFEVTGIAEGGSNLNLGLNSNLSIFSNCGDINNNQTASGTIFVQGTLPVDLVNFEANRIEDKVKLNWSTASEEQNEYFEVLRSRNLEDWHIVGVVPGAGTTSVQQDYSLVDENPMAGDNYYQLRQVDYNGDDSFSEIVHLRFEGGDGYKIEMYPNPFRDLLQIRNLDVNNIKKARIIDVKGSLISEVMLQEPFIHSEFLENGLYFIQVLDSEERIVHTQKVLKIR